MRKDKNKIPLYQRHLGDFVSLTTIFIYLFNYTMSYRIENKTGSKALSSFYFNGNFTVDSIIVLRSNSWFSFDSYQEALDYLDNCIETAKKETHYIDGLCDKIVKRLEGYKNNISEWD